MQDGQAFFRLLDEYGGPEEEEDITDALGGKPKDSEGKESFGADKKEAEEKGQTALMSEEERNRGSVPMSVYGQYLKHAGGIVWAPFILLLLVMGQGAQGNSSFDQCRFGG